MVMQDDKRECAQCHLVSTRVGVVGGVFLCSGAETQACLARVKERLAAERGDVHAIARAWALTARTTDALTEVQTRCNELLEETRAQRRTIAKFEEKLREIRKAAYRVKFGTEQGVSPESLHEAIVAILDEAASDDRA